MSKYLLALVLLLTYLSCKQGASPKKINSFQADIRLGHKYYSIHINREGEGYITKGNGTYYTEPLQIKTSNYSKIFKIDSANLLFINLNKLKHYPVTGAKREGMPRIEIYYEKNKIYDAYAWDETFWNIFRPIMEQLPKGFNPFLVSDNPFE